MEVKAITVLPRAGAIGIAVVLLILSAATIGIINNNKLLTSARDSNNVGGNSETAALQVLIQNTEAAAAWLIVLSIGVIAAKGTAIVLLYLNLPPIGKLIARIVEIIFAIAVILSYFGTGISCAVYAAGWGTNCSGGGPDSDANPCDSLIATVALAAVACFIQIGVFGVIAVMILLEIIKSRSTESKE